MVGIIEQFGQDSLKFIEDLKANAQKSVLRSPKARKLLLKATKTVEEVKSQSMQEIQKLKKVIETSELTKKAQDEIQLGAKKLVETLSNSSAKAISPELKAEMVDLLTKAKDSTKGIPANWRYLNSLFKNSLSTNWTDVKNFKVNVFEKLLDDAQKSIEQKRLKVNAAVDQVAENVTNAAVSAADKVSRTAEGFKEKTFKRGNNHHGQRQPNQSGARPDKNTPRSQA